MDVNGYLDMVPTENSKLPKFMGLLGSILEPVVDLQYLANDVSAFDPSAAAGDQLDIVGQIIGLPRQLPYVTDRGTTDMTDEEYRLGVQLKIAQESWSGGNKSATDIYQTVIGTAGTNISYNDLMDGNVTLSIGVESQDIIQIVYAIGGFLVPAGIGKTIEVSDTGATANVVSGIALTGMEINITVELGGQ